MGKRRELSARRWGIYVKGTEDLEMLKREVETRCPVSDNLGNPTPVNITVSAPRVREAVYA